MTDHRYTDRDIKQYPELRMVAIEYLRDYAGEFDPIVQAKAMLPYYTPSTFPGGVIRLVLNTMRSDPYAVGRLPNLQRDPVPVHNQEPVRFTVPDESPVKSAKRVPFELNVTWVAGLAASTWPTASVYHTLDAVRSTIRYVPPKKSREWGEFKPVIYTLCSNQSRHLLPLLVPPRGFRECSACAEIRDHILQTKDQSTGLQRLLGTT